MLDICLLGTGGMMPLPRRFLTSLYVKYQGHAVLIDCGESTQTAMRCASSSMKDIDIICITHFHADHVAGLPGLLLSMGNSGRTEPIVITGPVGLSQILSGLLVIAPELPFEIYVQESGVPDEGQLQLGNLFIKSFPVEHRIPCRGYVFELPRAGRFLADRADALGVPQKYWSKLQRGETVTIGDQLITPEQVLGPPRKGLKLLYSTDTRPVQAIVDYGMGADLMILEGIYPEESKLDKAIEHGHMIFTEAAALAKAANASELWLTHFSPAIDTPSDAVDVACKVFPNTITGVDGMKKMLRFTD